MGIAQCNCKWCMICVPMQASYILGQIRETMIMHEWYAVALSSEINSSQNRIILPCTIVYMHCTYIHMHVIGSLISYNMY